MKDEEMAEQFADNISGLELTCSLLSAKDKNHAYRLGRYEGFLAGLKAGRPQWHDLRKDPNDLPNEPNEKMSVNETWVYVKFFDNTYGLVDKGAIKNYKGAIAWCEIPTFDKE